MNKPHMRFVGSILCAWLVGAAVSACGARVASAAATEGQPILTQDAIWAAAPAGKVSSFGRYAGYSKPGYTQAVRQSVYVTVRDGTRLAVDVYRPAVNGQAVAKKAPAVMEATRYWRATQLPIGRVATNWFGTLAPGQNLIDLQYGPEWSTTLLSHGYVVVVADSRGTGASFGLNPGPLTRTEARDNHDLIEWISRQSWSSGKVGMGGRSYTGTNQVVTLLEPSPHLKAVFPSVPNFELFKVAVNGGVVRKGGILSMYNRLVKLGTASDPNMALPQPVDEDRDGLLRAQARAEQGEASFSGYTTFLQTPAYDRVANELGLKTLPDRVRVLGWNKELLPRIASRPDLQRELLMAGHFRNEANSFDFSSPGMEKSISPASHLKEINSSGVPAYYWSGWRDTYPTDALLFYANTDSPTKLTMGPWSHNPSNQRGELMEEEHYRLFAIEMLRWFDYWLKGIDNGIMQEPAIHYAVMEGERKWEWFAARQWPVVPATPVDMYFQQGRSGSVASINDGLLTAAKPAQAEAFDTFVVDYTATSGTKTRFHDSTGGGPLNYPDLSFNDSKGLTYTTEPLEKDLVVLGNVIVTLHAKSTAPDGEFSLYLEDVDASGYSRFLADGYIRALNRTLGQAFYDNLGLPWPTDARADAEKLPPLSAGMTEIRFALESVGARLKAGHRLRITIQGADADGTLTVPVVPSPKVTIGRSAAFSSRITVPVLNVRDR